MFPLSPFQWRIEKKSNMYCLAHFMAADIIELLGGIVCANGGGVGPPHLQRRMGDLRQGTQIIFPAPQLADHSRANHHYTT
jgi:hypothetical protein